MRTSENKSTQDNAMIPIPALALTFGVPIARLAANLVVKGLDLIDGQGMKVQADEVVTDAGLLKVYQENGKYFCANTNKQDVLCTFQQGENVQYPNGNVNYRNESLSFLVESLTTEEITNEIQTYGDDGIFLNNYPETETQANVTASKQAGSALRRCYFGAVSFAGAVLAISGGDIVINRFSDPSRRWFNVQSSVNIRNFKFRFVDVAGNQVSGTAPLLNSAPKSEDPELYEYTIDLPSWVDPNGAFKDFQVSIDFTPENFEALMAKSKKELQHLPVPKFVMNYAEGSA